MADKPKEKWSVMVVTAPYILDNAKAGWNEVGDWGLQRAKNPDLGSERACKNYFNKTFSECFAIIKEIMNTKATRKDDTLQLTNAILMNLNTGVLITVIPTSFYLDDDGAVVAYKLQRGEGAGSGPVTLSPLMTLDSVSLRTFKTP